MGLDGFDAQVQLVGGVLGAFSFGDQLQDFGFAFRQFHLAGFAGGAGTAGEGLKDVAGDFRTDVEAAVVDGPDGIDQFGEGAVLEEVTGGAGLQHAGDEMAVGVHGEGEDSGFWGFLPKAPGRCDTIEVGHGHVEDDDIRREGPGQFTGFEAVDAFADDSHVGLGFEERAQTIADNAVVIAEDNLDTHGWMMTGRAGIRQGRYRFCASLLFFSLDAGAWFYAKYGIIYFPDRIPGG